MWTFSQFAKLIKLRDLCQESGLSSEINIIIS